MSVQTGMLSFDGRPIAEETIDYLLFGLESRGPDYSATHIEHSLAMGIHGLWITPEDSDDQPRRGQSGAVLTFDGRLDRRSDLAQRLGVLSTTVSDAQLVLTAYESLGERCFGLLLGEFALVLWDKVGQRVFLARSVCGTCPLYYLFKHDSVVWSSELEDLVIKSEDDPVVNDEYAMGFIYYMPDINLSPYRNVHVVKPGTYLSIGFDGSVGLTVPLWHPEQLQTVELSDDAEYEEALREKVRDAVADRIRTRKPIWCELSGGLDSSTIFSVADSLLRAMNHDRSSLTSVSFTFERSNDCDERAFIQIVEQAADRRSAHICESDQAITLGLDNISFTGFPSTVHMSKTYETVGSLMRESGARVLLTGVGGDELFCSGDTGSPEIADLLSDRRIFQAFRETRRWSQVSGTPFWRMFLVEGISPLTIGVPLLEWKPCDVSNLCSWSTAEARAWLTRRNHRVGLEVENGIQPPSRRMRLFSIRSFCALLSTGHFRGIQGVHVSHPYAHQCLMEFILSIPMHQLTRPGQDRFLMRGAMRGVLPEKIRTRRSKGTLDEALGRALMREQDGLRGCRMLVCERGYVNPTKLVDAIEEMSIGKLRQIAAFTHVLSAERWLRSLQGIPSRRAEVQSRFRSRSAIEIQCAR